MSCAKSRRSCRPPVVMTANGKGAVSDRDPLAQVIAGIDLVEDTDVIFAVGTRFVDPSTSVWKLPEGRTVIQMDIDAEEIGRNYPVTVGIEADAKAWPLLPRNSSAWVSPGHLAPRN